MRLAQPAGSSCPVLSVFTRRLGSTYKDRNCARNLRSLEGYTYAFPLLRLCLDLEPLLCMLRTWVYGLLRILGLNLGRGRAIYMVNCPIVPDTLVLGQNT